MNTYAIPALKEKRAAVAEWLLRASLRGALRRFDSCPRLSKKVTFGSPFSSLDYTTLQESVKTRLTCMLYCRFNLSTRCGALQLLFAISVKSPYAAANILRSPHLACGPWRGQPPF